jgi:hypothetical protein
MRENKRKLTLKKIKIAAMNGIRGGDETTTLVGMSDSCPTQTPGCESNDPECQIPASDPGNVCSDTCPLLTNTCATCLVTSRCY